MSVDFADGYAGGAAKKTKFGFSAVRHHLQNYASPEKHLNKSFSFPHDQKWELPAIQECSQKSCTVNKLQALKHELNNIKNELSDKEAITWHEHTSHVNISSGVIPTLKREIKPELLTQAWCKFYEILSTYDIIKPDDNSDFATLHLCEAPGAFIAALNHFLKSNPNYEQIKWKWIANSLNPYYEGTERGSVIDDDRLIRHTIENWCFGSGNTGDILSDDILASIRKRNDLLPVNLVTADGSIDCSKNPGEQEKTVSHLHWTEVTIALSVLAPAGCFVLKLFTFYENSSVCLMYFLNCMFDKVDVFKPGTSKSGNSEVYVVCRGFKGASTSDQVYLQKLRVILDSSSGSMCEDWSIYEFDDIPKDFLRHLTECAQLFFNYQISTIKYNIELYNDENIFNKHRKEIKDIQRSVKSKFLEKCGLVPINSEDKLSHNQRHAVPYFRYGRVVHSYCYNDRTDPSSYSQILKNQLEEIYRPIIKNATTSELQLLNKTSILADIAPIYGIPFKRVNTSSFCCHSILNLVHYCRENGLINDTLSDKVICNDAQVQELCKEFYYDCENIVLRHSPHQTLEISSMISKYLSHCNIRVEAFQESSSCDDLNFHHLYILEMIHQHFFERPVLKSICLQEICQIIQNGGKDCSVLVVVQNTMCRFVSGIIYILGSLFEKITFMYSSNQGQNLSAVEFVIFHSANNLDDSASLVDQLSHLSTSLSQLHTQPGPYTLLEIIPTPILLQNERYQRCIVENNHKQLITKLWNSICI